MFAADEASVGGVVADAIDLSFKLAFECSPVDFFAGGEEEHFAGDIFGDVEGGFVAGESEVVEVFANVIDDVIPESVFALDGDGVSVAAEAVSVYARIKFRYFVLTDSDAVVDG